MGFYKRYSDNFFLQALVPAFLAAVILITTRFFIPYKLYVIPSMIISVIATLLIPLHAYLLFRARKEVSIEKTQIERKMEYYKNELAMHKWLLYVIREMVQRKVQKFREREYPIGEKEYRNAAMKNLDMLREFYEHFKNDPAVHFRTVFFQPSEDGTFLRSTFYSTPNGEPPSSHGNDGRQKEIFNKTRSQTLAVSAWRDLSPKIAENPEEISYTYPQQRDIIKSLLAFPVFSGKLVAEDLIGIITVSCNEASFFSRHELDRHKDYISEFAMRIDFEFCKLQSSGQMRK